MAQQKLKEVRALRAGSYDGHRRRVGATFYVRADVKEGWFEDVGPAPADAELSPQRHDGQVSPGKSFIDVMNELGKPRPPAPVSPTPITLAEAQAGAPLDANEDLV